jgi:hypothetical protein
MLVYFGDAPVAVKHAVRSRLRHLEFVPDAQLYLCDGCRETLLREGILRKPDMLG